MDSWRRQYGSIWVFVRDALTACMWFELLRCLALPPIQVSMLCRWQLYNALAIFLL